MKLYYFPLSTYSQKVTIAMHEKGIEAEKISVMLFDPAERDRYREVYPLGKIPLLVLDDGHHIPESSTIVEYLDTEHAGGTRLIPADPTASRQTRFHDRMLDLYLNEAITSLIFESWKPENERNAETIERAHIHAGVIYDFMDHRLADSTWLMGDGFTLADCAAAPPLFYAQQFFPFTGRANIEAYWSRIEERPSWQAVFAEAEPLLEMMRERAVGAGAA